MGGVLRDLRSLWEQWAWFMQAARQPITAPKDCATGAGSSACWPHWCPGTEVIIAADVVQPWFATVLAEVCVC